MTWNTVYISHVNKKTNIFLKIIFDIFRAIMMKPSYENAIDSSENIYRENKVVFHTSSSARGCISY